MIVTVELASQLEHPVLANLLQLYLHDFSVRGGPPIGADGRFDYPRLEAYWFEKGRYPFLIRADGNLAGFALVAARELLEPGADPPEIGHELVEFFVVRGLRRRGVGGAAARELFARFPGRWWVGELTSNEPAIAFWRRVIGDATRGAYAEEGWQRGGQRGIVQIFTV
jgi:predicted acetyltransferase